MNALSLQLEPYLLTESTAIAKELGMSRSQYIRHVLKQAIMEHAKRKQLAKMANAFDHMKKDVDYQKIQAEFDQDDWMLEEIKESPWWDV